MYVFKYQIISLFSPPPIWQAIYENHRPRNHCQHHPHSPSSYIYPLPSHFMWGKGGEGGITETPCIHDAALHSASRQPQVHPSCETALKERKRTRKKTVTGNITCISSQRQPVSCHHHITLSKHYLIVIMYFATPFSALYYIF